MAVAPGTYNFTLQRRADYSVLLQFKDSNDAVIAYTDRSNGKITISLTDAQTATFPNSLQYDVMLEDSSNTREYYLEGTITVSQGYTSP